MYNIEFHKSSTNLWRGVARGRVGGAAPGGVARVRAAGEEDTGNLAAHLHSGGGGGFGAGFGGGGVDVVVVGGGGGGGESEYTSHSSIY